jgi:hypothetical protein
MLTGDADLRALHPFQGIAIRTPGEYLKAESAKPEAIF